MSPTDAFDQIILEELGRPDYTPMRTKELARALGIPKRDYRDFRDCLKTMARSEKVVRKRGTRWALPAPERRLEGSLTITRSGPGFLAPDDTRLDDVYIPEQELGTALHGDRVAVVMEHPEGHGYRQYGRVVEVLERGSPRIVAVVTPAGTAQAEDPKNPFEYRIEPGGPDVAPDNKILLEITCWPSETEEAAGRVLEVLGPAGEPDTETAAILAGYDAPGPFPEVVKAEVRNLSREISKQDLAERLDFRDSICVTIDPEDARDYDDALSVEKKEDGSFVVGVHIADVSRYVRPGTRLDEEARERSTSIYLPQRVIPMLPEELSNDLCSLRPDEDRFAKTVFLRYDAEGRRTNYEIHRSIIRSTRRFTYEEALSILRDPDSAGELASPEVIDTVVTLGQLATTLRAARLKHGTIELHIPEMRIVLDEQGRACDIAQVPQDESHQLVEDFMLAANVALAEWCKKNGMPVLYRAHESPNEERMEELAEFLTASGYPFKPPFKRERLKTVIEKARGRPEEHAINLAILKSFMKAIYSPNPEIGHFALNFPNYMHFTSPIRRYPDLHLHQMLDDVFSENADKLPKTLRKLPPKAGKAIDGLGIHTSQRERRAMQIENAVKDFRRLELLSQQEEREFDAVVTGIRKFGIFVEIEHYFVESMIPRWMLEKKGYAAREEAPGKKRRNHSGHRKPGFHLGQEVRVRITNIDLPARMCEMEFVGVNKPGS